jgi:hypothetical protein
MTLVVLTPSYAPDLELCTGLNRSVLQYASQDVHHVLIVPPADVPAFSQLAGDRTSIRTEPEFLPRSFVRAPLVNATINLRRPFPPVRGWILQQVLKLAATASMDADVVVLVDSDIEFVRPFSAETFLQDGVVRFYRKPDEIDERLPRHVLWHRASRELLGLPPADPPLPDYVASLIAWDPSIVRQMLDRIEKVTGRRWADAVASQLHFSEWTLYGVFVDALSPDAAKAHSSDAPLCHAWWGTDPLGPHNLDAFVADFGDHDVACMISAKSHTPPHIRRVVLDALREITSNEHTG